MQHNEHAAKGHEAAGALGGVLDGVAVGLGFGMAVGGLVALRGVLSVPAWFGIVTVTTLIGGILGSIWGKNRGY